MTRSQPKPAAPFRKLVFATLGEAYGDNTVSVCPGVFVRLFNGDHQAAILLSQILYWAERTKNPDGWFYKSYAEWRKELHLSEFQVRRILYGDKRVKAQRVTLSELGIETMIRKVKAIGAPVQHFRVNQTRFLASLKRLLGQDDPQHCQESTPNNVEDRSLTLSGINPEQCAPSSDQDSKITNPENSSEDYNHPMPAPHPDDDSGLSIFLPFENRFSKLKTRFREPLCAELERLGTAQVREVLDRCVTRGHSWNYVLSALANEAPAVKAEVPAASIYGDEPSIFSMMPNPNFPPEPADAPLPVSERLQLIWPGPMNAQATMQKAWDSAMRQFELQIDDPTFQSCLGKATLVDFKPESQTFVLVVRTAFARDMLLGRLVRMMKRITRDFIGPLVEVEYLLKEDWLALQGGSDGSRDTA